VNRHLLSLSAGFIALGLITGCFENPADTKPVLGTFKIDNSSSFTISEVYITGTTGSWGNNKLSFQTVTPGNTYPIPDAPAGTYNVKAVTSTGEYFIKTDITIAAGQTVTVTFTDANFGATGATGSLKIVNNSLAAITTCYIALATDLTWGADRLGGTSIPAGQSRTVSSLVAGVYTVKATTTASDSAIKTDITVTSGETATVTFTAGDFKVTSQTGSIKIVNNSTAAITTCYIVLAADTSLWGANRLGGTSIPAGGTRTIAGLVAGAYAVNVGTATLKSATKTMAISGQTVSVTFSDSDFGGADATTNLTLVNSSTHSIWYFYVSPADSSTWGDERLGDVGIVSAGEQFVLPPLTAGVYSLRVETGDDLYAEAFDNPLSADSVYTWTITDAMLKPIAPPTGAGSVRITNNTSYAIDQFYIWSIDSLSMGENRVGASGAIPAGGSFVVNDLEPGLYDLGIETEGGLYYTALIDVTVTDGEQYQWDVGDGDLLAN
jgi:hypothetical protein